MIKLRQFFNTMFWVGWTLALWDMYQSILAAGDTPYRLHHGWIGLAMVAIAWGVF